MTTPAATPSPGRRQRRSKARRGPRQALAPSARAPSAQQPPPVRLCIGCRRSRPQAELLQLVMGTAEGQPPAGAGGKRGRASYVCADSACFLAVNARQEAHEGASFLQRIEALARLRFVGMLGLCRRQGLLVVGAGRIADAKTGAEGMLIYAARDLAPRTMRQLQPHGEVRVTMLDAMALGRAVGQTNVGAVAICPSRLGHRAAYWLRVWYEARPPDGAAPQGPHGACEPSNSELDDRRIEVAR